MNTVTRRTAETLGPGPTRFFRIRLRALECATTTPLRSPSGRALTGPGPRSARSSYGRIRPPPDPRNGARLDETRRKKDLKGVAPPPLPCPDRRHPSPWFGRATPLPIALPSPPPAPPAPPPPPAST